MKRAFHSITPPPNFQVEIFEHNVEGMFFIEVVADEAKFIKLLDEDKRSAVEYMVRVKDALERNGAIVQISRRPIDE